VNGALRIEPHDDLPPPTRTSARAAERRTAGLVPAAGDELDGLDPENVFPVRLAYRKDGGPIPQR